MRRFILGWKLLGHEQRLQAKIVNYADDFVICCRRSADAAMDAMRSIMRTLKLTINEEKTHVCRAPDESFDFLGYTFGTCYSRRNGWRFITERPSKQKIQAICRRISELTNRGWCWRDVDEQVGQLNQIMVGWARYFCHGPITQPYRTVNEHACRRLRRWLRQKHKVQGRACSYYPNEYLHEKLGLVQLRLSDFNVPRANA
jgi:RNA-directed DNA polymerase